MKELNLKPGILKDLKFSEGRAVILDFFSESL